MTYRRLDKPPFSAWLVAERTKRAWKAEEVARRLRELGYAAEDSTYRTWEAGRRPGGETVAALERLFESAAPGDGAPASGDVAAAVRAQTETFAQLLATMAGRLDAAERRADALEQLLLGATGKPAPDPDALARYQAWAASADAQSRPQLPARPGDTER